MKWSDRIGRRLKLHDLHVLMTVAETGSMGRAAERLAVSPPSVSKAISDMEHVIGGTSSRQRLEGALKPTGYGRALLRHSIGAFDELRQGIKAIESLSDPSNWRGQDRLSRCFHQRRRVRRSSTTFPGNTRHHRFAVATTQNRRGWNAYDQMIPSSVYWDTSIIRGARLPARLVSWF